MPMNDEQLLRYSRQIMLPQLDIEGQEKLLASTVLIVGVGGLGCPAALYLAGAGVGTLVLADPDEVDLSNLQRQVAHKNAGLGRPKVESAADTIRELNPQTGLLCRRERLEGEALRGAVAGADLVLDATDNFAARFAINRACIAARVPLVSGAAIRMEAQISVFDPRDPASPCYHCLYEEGEEADMSCARNGVMAPLVGIVGSIQAMEAVKLLAGIGRPLTGRLLLLDAMDMSFREMKLRKNPDCPVCGAKAPFLRPGR